MLQRLRSGARPLFALPLIAIAVGLVLAVVALTRDRASDGPAAGPPSPGAGAPEQSAPPLKRACEVVTEHVSVTRRVSAGARSAATRHVSVSERGTPPQRAPRGAG